MSMRFWKNKKVLVTGYAGFLGSHLTKKLISCGSYVVGVDIKTGSARSILTKDDYRNITSIRGNVCNYKMIKKIIEQYEIDVIFHLAAEAIVGKCMKEPMRAFSSNIKGTWTVLEACRMTSKIKAIIVASSDKAYGSHEHLPYKEDTPLCGRHPYDASKSCTDLIAHAYFHAYEVPVAITRCGNIYGPGDFNFSRLLPDFFKRIASGAPLLIRSDGTYTRDYIFVDDIVKGYMLLAENLNRKKLGGEAFNFSYEKPISVVEVVEKLYHLAGEKPSYRIADNAKYEIKHQYLSSAKARRVLGWKPENTLEEGLKTTIRWYRAFFNNIRRNIE